MGNTDTGGNIVITLCYALGLGWLYILTAVAMPKKTGSENRPQLWTFLKNYNGSYWGFQTLRIGGV